MNFLGIFKLIFSSLILSIFLTGCNKPNQEIKNSICFNRQYTCFNNIKRLEISTNKGKLILQLDGKNAPVTVGHFLKLVENGIYNKTKFNRVIREPKPYIIQGGDPLNRLVNISTNHNSISGESIYSRFIPLEISIINEEIPRYNEIIGANFHEKIKLRHAKGSISMARSDSLSSASSQFYISLRRLPELDGRYAVFGEIIDGFNILNLIEEGDYILSIKEINY